MAFLVIYILVAVEFAMTAARHDKPAEGLLWAVLWPLGVVMLLSETMYCVIDNSRDRDRNPFQIHRSKSNSKE